MQNDNLLEFDHDQKAEIQAGIEEGLDVSWYAKPEFLAIQMNQIRLGLSEGLDVSVYAKTDYDWFQMEEIRKGIRAGLDYQIYAKPEIDYKHMRQVRKGLKQGMDLSKLIGLDAGILKELRKAAKTGISLTEYIKEGYDVSQLAQIRSALEKHLDIKPYICTELIGPSIREIALGLEQGLPVSVYANTEYSWRQMREIRLGMERRMDVGMYQNSLFSWQQMREIRLGLEEGLEVDAYRKFMYTASEMKRIRSSLVLEETKSILSDDEMQENGEINVFISHDEMEACIEVHYEDSVELTKGEVLESLKRSGVCHGILSEEVERLIKEKRYHQTIVIARGLPAQQGESGWYEFFFNTSPDRSPKILADGSADYRNIDWFEMVKAGDKIAFYHSAGFGKAGYTVKGKFIRAKKGLEKKTLSGYGFRLHEDGKTYYAAIDGKIEMVNENRIDVSRVCVLDNVNLATGDVKFEGSVYVKGNVGSGASIYASESVVIDGYVEAANIICGGDILLRRGVNGQGFIQAKGNVSGQFFEAARIEAEGDISAQYFLNCELHTEGFISTRGEKGLLAGGNARAARGISAYTIGNKTGLRTVLNVGLDAKILERMRRLENKTDRVEKEMRILNNSYEDLRSKYPAEVRNTMELYLKIENAIYTKKLQADHLSEQKQALSQKIKEMMGAQVTVNDILYEGTIVTVDNIRWQAFMIRDVSIKCRNQKIVVESN